MKIFKKLVRDKMPDIMAEKGSPITTRQVANDEEFIAALENKLLEEVQELRNKEQPALVQIAYMQEILDALIKAHHISSDEVLKERNQKYDERGGFDRRLFLEGTEEK